MSDEKGLLAAIWEHPHDDTPRLVYADWLDEHDQPARAEFIRLQCERDRLDEWDDGPRVGQLRQREADLWQVHREAWLAGLPKAVHHALFRRGFPAPRRKQLPGSKLLKLTPADFAAAPLWDVSLTVLYRDFDAVFASPVLPRFGALAVSLYDYPYDAAARLAGNNSLRNVRDLELKGARLTPGGVAAFFNGPAAAAVTDLRLRTSVAGDHLAALATARAAGQLRSLSLDLQSVVPTPTPWFAPAHFPRLRSLDVEGRNLGYRGGAGRDVLEALFTGSPETGLRRLDLKDYMVGDDGVGRLAAWPGLAHLRWLNLRWNEFREAGYRALARSPHAGNLTRLRVPGYWLRERPAVKAELDARFGAVIRYG